MTVLDGSLASDGSAVPASSTTRSRKIPPCGQRAASAAPVTGCTSIANPPPCACVDAIEIHDDMSCGSPRICTDNTTVSSLYVPVTCRTIEAGSPPSRSPCRGCVTTPVGVGGGSPDPLPCLGSDPAQPTHAKTRLVSRTRWLSQQPTCHDAYAISR